MANQYIVGFNGPPESGKDTLAEMLAEVMDSKGVTLPVRMESLSNPLRGIAYLVTGYQGKTDGEDYVRFKNAEFDLVSGGATGRRVMIDVSERFLKECYGKNIMSKMLLERNKDFHGVLLLRDCGFQNEVDVLEKVVGTDNFCLVKVERPGTTFANDSRAWIHTGGWSIRIPNIGTLDDLRNEAKRIYDLLVNQVGWEL